MSTTSGTKGVSDSSSDQRKSSSSETKRSLPQPPAKAGGGKSLLATDSGDDIPLLDDDEEIDLLENASVGSKKKTRMSIASMFSSRNSRKKPKKTKPPAGRGSFMGFFMPKNAKTAFQSINQQDEGDRIDSVVWRRKESTDMTKSLEMDMDIYQYMKERSPSFEEEAAELERPVSILPPKEPEVPSRQAPQTRSNLLATTGGNGGVRQDTKIPELELKNKKKGNFFSRMFRRKRNKDGTKRPGFASRVMSRMSFRSSYKGTKGDDLRSKLNAMELQEEQKAAQKAEVEAEGKGLFRKDSDQTDLSGDSDIDSSLLVNDVRSPKVPQVGEEQGRLSKIFEDEEEPRPKAEKTEKTAFINTKVTKSSDELPQVATYGDRLSNEKIQAEADKTQPEQAFSLST